MITLEKYSKAVGIPDEILLGKSREYPVASAREVYWMYLYQNGLSHVKIAAMFGRGRSTVTCGIRTAKNLISTKDEWALFCYGKLNIESQETKHIRQPV